MAKLDDLLSAPDPAADAPTDKLRAAVFAELDAAAPKRTWRADVVLLVGLCWGLVMAAGVVLFVAGEIHLDHVVQRVVPLASLFLVGAYCAFAALAPRRRTRLVAGFLVAAVGLVGLVLVRGAGVVSTAAPWVCTLSHLSVGAAPLVLALTLLRKSAMGPVRAALAGIAVGTTGAMLGELACEQGWAHVAVWHLGAWVGLVLVAMAVSSRLVPRSFAP